MATDQHDIYIVCGAGISGRAAARWLLQHGKEVLLYDEDAQQLSTAAVQALKQAGGQVTAHAKQVRRALEYCTELVVSPGIAGNHDLLAAARAQGVSVCSEVELGLRAYRGKIAAVTGTNGKSTVCAMLHHILQGLSWSSALAGNIGTAVTEVLLPRRTAPELLVVELSSFQLEHTCLPALDVAIFTNFTPSHLARHGDTATYFALKQKLFAALSSEGLAICDSSVQAQLTVVPPHLSVVAPDDPVPDAKIFAAYTPHDRCNAMMALLAAQKLSGLSLPQLVPHLQAWQGLPYRLQLVGHFDGKAVINDSKATDIAATLAALHAQSTPVLLIFGGNTAEAQQLLKQRHKIAGILAFGTPSRAVRAQLRQYVLVQAYTDLAALLASLPHIRVPVPLLFSPACVSQPEFANFEERGRFFDDSLSKLAKFKN